MNHLSLFLLGTFKVTINEKPVTHFEYDKVRALLAYLAIESNVPHRRDTLTNLFWPEQTDSVARKSLNQALYTLRKALGDKKEIANPFILADRTAVQFNPAANAWIDVRLFEEMAKTVSGAKDDDEEETAVFTQLKEAVSLYRGDYLKGLSISGSPDFDDWLAVTRERLHRQAIEILDRLTHIETLRGNWQLAMNLARRQVELEPWREEAHCQLMLLLARTGDNNAAIAQYETCKSILATELGLAPTPETTRLHQRIVAVRNGEYLHNLPLQHTDLIGREEELQQLRQLLAHPHKRLISLIGPGGIGKTQLAIAAAHQNRHRFLEGIAFVPLAGLTEPEQIITSIARSLSFPLRADTRHSPKQQVLDYLCRKEMLLVLDNFEHLLEGAHLITDLINEASDIQLIITSRERLNLQYEQLYPVKGLDYPELADESFFTNANPKPEQSEPTYAAGQLFLQAAQRQQPGFLLKTTGENQSLVALTRQVAGMPLALELAASWIDKLALPDILAEIQKNLDFLESERWHSPERHHSIRAVFDTSWKLLNEPEQAAFAQLSVFRGGFTYPAASQITNISFPQLSALINKSLISYDQEHDRYEIHELLRQYGAEKLAEHRKVEVFTKEQHSVYFCNLMQISVLKLGTDKHNTALEEIELDLDNTRAAWDWTLAQLVFNRLEETIESMARFYDWRYMNHEGAAKFSAAVGTVRKIYAEFSQIPDKVKRILAHLIYWQSMFEAGLGNIAKSVELLDNSLALLQLVPTSGKLDIRPDKARIFMEMGERSKNKGLFEEAIQKQKHALSLFRESRDEWGEAYALRRLGATAWFLGEYDESRHLLKEGLTISKLLKAKSPVASSLYWLALVSVSQGQLEYGEELTREGISIHKEMDHQRGIAAGLGNLGSILTLQGRFAESNSLLMKSINLSNRLDYQIPFLRYKHSFIFTQLHLGNYEVILEIANENLMQNREIGNPWETGRALQLLGAIELIHKNYAKALAYLEESLALLKITNGREAIAVTNALLAYVSNYLDKPDQTLNYLSNALGIAVDINAFEPLLWALPAAALLASSQGKSERANELYSLASRYTFVANSHWFKDMVGKQISATAPATPPKEVTETQSNGNAQNLWETAGDLLVELRGVH